MRPEIWLVIGVIFALVVVANIARVIWIYRAASNEEEGAVERKARARRDKKRFDEELTPQAMREGAR